MIRHLLNQKLSARFLIFLACLSFSASILALEAGAQAYDFELAGTQGTLKLSQIKGKVIYLDFWASWCGPCRESFPWMNEMQEKYKQLEVVAINLDANDNDAKKFLAQHSARFKVLFDPKGLTPEKYGVMGMPTSFIISKNGKVLVQHMGFKQADRADLERLIQSALGDQK